MKTDARHRVPILPENDMPRLYSAPWVARLIGRDPATVTAAIREHRFPGVFWLEGSNPRLRRWAVSNEGVRALLKHFESVPVRGPYNVHRAGDDAR